MQVGFDKNKEKVGEKSSKQDLKQSKPRSSIWRTGELLSLPL